MTESQKRAIAAHAQAGALPFGISQSAGTDIKGVADIIAPGKQLDIAPVKQGSDVIRAKMKKNRTPVTFVLTAGGMDAWFYIGDPTGAVVAKSAKTPTPVVATSGTMSPEAWNRLTGTPDNDFVVKQINYRTSSNTSQFSQPLLVGYFEGAGDYSEKSIDTYISAGQRNTAQDPLLQTLDLTDDMPVLNSNAALLIYVLAGETVNFTLSPGMFTQK